MIEIRLKERFVARNPLTNPLYKILAIIVLLDKFSKLRFHEISICLWAISCDNNLKIYNNWTKLNATSRIPAFADDNLHDIIQRCCLCGIFDREGDRNFSYSATAKAKEMLGEMGNDDFVAILRHRIANIRKPTQTKIDSLSYLPLDL